MRCYHQWLDPPPRSRLAHGGLPRCGQPHCGSGGSGLPVVHDSSVSRGQLSLVGASTASVGHLCRALSPCIPWGGCWAPCSCGPRSPCALCGTSTVARCWLVYCLTGQPRGLSRQLDACALAPAWPICADASITCDVMMSHATHEFPFKAQQPNGWGAAAVL